VLRLTCGMLKELAAHLIKRDLSSKTWTGLLLIIGLLGSSEVVFEFQWGLVMQSAVKSVPIIEGFNVIE
jgi:hypothetical protein